MNEQQNMKVPQSTEIISVPISDINTRGRVRKDMGDIDALAKSIESVGLLQPIGIDHDDNLVLGERRLRAFKKLGRETIPARIVSGMYNATVRLKAERDENTCRKEFSPMEMAKMREKLEKLEKKLAKERQGTRTDLQHSGNLPQSSGGKSRDIIGKQLGTSGKTLDKISYIHKNGTPELKKAVDEKEISVSEGNEIAALNKEDQAEIVSIGDKKARKEKTETKKYEISGHSPYSDEQKRTWREVKEILNLVGKAVEGRDPEAVGKMFTNPHEYDHVETPGNILVGYEKAMNNNIAHAHALFETIYKIWRSRRVKSVN